MPVTTEDKTFTPIVLGMAAAYLLHNCGGEMLSSEPVTSSVLAEMREKSSERATLLVNAAQAFA
jgi:hypothetical protein